MNGIFPGGLDPSKLSPQTIAEISNLMRTLTPEQIMKMQSLMHNSMAGFNVNNEMLEFEKSLPAGFREKMAKIMYQAHGINVGNETGSPSTIEASAASTTTPASEPQDMTEARLIILRSVAGGLMTPEEALKILFPAH